MAAASLRPQPASALDSDARRLAGLDTIRFFCAAWVVMGHVGLPPLPIGPGGATTTLGWLVRGVYNNVVSGPAAVIVFFIISGICIHLPHASCNRVPSLWAHFARRYIRIVPPMLVALLVARHLLGLNLTLFENSILWSLFAELVYYTIYPIVLAVRRAGTPWDALVAIALAAAFSVAATNPSAGNYPSFGLSGNWLLGLPCWLIGCAVAERIAASTDGRRERPRVPVWTLRALILLLAMGCSVLRFHSPLGYPWTLNLFALAGGFWLLAEVRHFAVVRPLAITEWAGSWSYSLYLVHLLALSSLTLLPLPQMPSLPLWAAKMGYVLAFALLFAWLVEFPSHKLARVAARSRSRTLAGEVA